MATELNETQIRDLTNRIYNQLMEQDEFGLGESGPCYEAAERIVFEWMEENDIEQNTVKDGS